MDSQLLQEWFEQQLPVLESFLKTIMLKKINTEISAASISDTDLVIEALKTGTVLASATEPNYNKSIYIAFDENWIPQLSKAMLGMEEEDVNEVTNDLIKEFSSQLLGTAQAALDEQGAQLEAGEVELIKSGQITNSVAEGDYFMVQIDVNGKFEIEGDDQPELAMIIAFELPDNEAFEEFFRKQKEARDLDVEADTEGAEDSEKVDEDDIDDLVDTAGGEGKKSTSEAEEEQAEQKQQQQQQVNKGQEAEEEPDTTADDTKQTAGKKTPRQEREPASGEPSHAQKVEFEDYAPGESQNSDVEVRNLDRLKEVELDISVELGRKQVELGTILRLVRGSVIELDKLAGEPVEVYANKHRIAEGEVIVIDEHFGVRITNLVSTRERIESLR